MSEVTRADWPERATAWMKQFHHSAGYLPRKENQLPEYRQDPLIAVHGGVGKDPVQRSTSKGTVVGFSIGVSTGYDKDAPTTWYDVSVWNEGLQESVLAEVQKGSRVAVEGFLSEREYQGKKYPQISAARVGLVEFLQRSASTAPQAAAPVNTPAPVAAPAAVDPQIAALQAQLAALQAQPATVPTSDDDLPF